MKAKTGSRPLTLTPSFAYRLFQRLGGGWTYPPIWLRSPALAVGRLLGDPVLLLMSAMVGGCWGSVFNRQHEFVLRSELGGRVVFEHRIPATIAAVGYWRYHSTNGWPEAVTYWGVWRSAPWAGSNVASFLRF